MALHIDYDDKKLTEKLALIIDEFQDKLEPKLRKTMSNAGVVLIDKYNQIPKKHSKGKTISTYKEFFEFGDGELSAKVGFNTLDAPQSVFFNYGTPYIQPNYYVEAAIDETEPQIIDTILNCLDDVLEG